MRPAILTNGRSRKLVICKFYFSVLFINIAVKQFNFVFRQYHS